MRKLKLRSTQREAAQASHISWTYNTSSLSDHNSAEILFVDPCEACGALHVGLGGCYSRHVVKGMHKG